MADNKLLTVVVPAYNMHDYLRRCLDSLCVDSVMSDVQVIVVNDGSTDDTSAIGHQYAQRYPASFLVIDKPNGNYGSCMNVALPLAEGKYFRTLDADDWYDRDAFARFVVDLSLSDADLVISEKVDHYSDRPNEVRSFVFPVGLPVLQDVSFDAIPWDNPALLDMMGVMFVTTRTDLLRSLPMRWSEDVFYSDFEYITIPLFQAKTVRLTPSPVYQYYLGRIGQSVDYSFSLANQHSYAVVLSAILDRLAQSQFLSSGAARLFQFKLELLVRLVYDLHFQHKFVLDAELQAIEGRIRQHPQLRSFTAGLTGFRGRHYVSAYRHNRLLFYLYNLDYRLRTNAFLRWLLCRR